MDNPMFNMPPIKPINVSDIKFKDDAETIAKGLAEEINRYNDHLDEKHLTGMALTSFGKEINIVVTSVGCKHSRLIIFHGFLPDNNQEVEIIQHATQINFLLIPLIKANNEEPKSRIGFTAE